MPKYTKLTMLPLQPLLEVGRYNERTLAAATGRKTLQIRNYRVRGVSLRTADELACAVNLHPTQVWGNAFYQPVSDSKSARARMS